MTGATAVLQRSRGALAVGFKRLGNRTVLARLYQDGCLKARLPRLPIDSAEAVCINTSGGLTDGDILETRIECGPGAAAVVTSQAAERIYRSRAGDAEISTTLRVGEAATLGWIPQETIVFDGGRVVRRLDVELASTATLLLIESAVLGRTAMGETVTDGALSDRWTVRVDGRLAFADAQALSGPSLDALRRRPAVLDGAIAFATFLFAAPEPGDILDALRRCAADTAYKDIHFGATRLDNLVVARLAAGSGAALHGTLANLISVVAGRVDAIHLPTVWSL